MSNREKNKHLIEAIEKHIKRPVADPVRAAFLAVDRAILVPHHYEQRPV